jgi:hypothetical protein
MSASLFTVKVNKYPIFRTVFESRARKEFNRLKSLGGKFDEFDLRLLDINGETLREKPGKNTITHLKSLGKMERGERLKKWGNMQQFLEKIRMGLAPQIEKIRSSVEL